MSLCKSDETPSSGVGVNKSKEENYMKDCVVTVSVFNRVMHRFIIRAADEKEAERMAKMLVEVTGELCADEQAVMTFSLSPFTHLSTEGCFVCF